MDRNRRLSARLCLLLLGLASQAEAREPQPCASRLLDAVARQVGHDGWIAPSYESSGPFLAVACKPWPDDPAQTVIAMAYLDPGDTAVEGERHPHLLLAKADSRSGKLLERYDSDFEEDASVAVGSDSLWLDTTRYRLSPTVRAFGVVFHSVARGASCPEAGFDNLLTLVVPAGEGKLRPVLNTYLDQWRTLKGSVCSAEPGFEQEVSHLTLELGRGRSNGFADLVVTSRVSDGETENGKPLRTVKRTLRYDGERYPFEEYSDFWHRQ
ncbi:TPA: hypothetical protein N0J77_000328 [Pseudomonas aeruginosa]|uniref:hypothetical protein n=1 Tax=Pseudomonas aeruginosa TaxID=287 RepID=UPI0029438DFD|nr:hypothetical protein [Pseudomonas aeruginosa]WOJ13759.1 hypothetical protein M0M55_06305 [Pseudomonas aeruginosa]HCK4324921.1 hypothetical protein [Pseudomonas aeruginosa]HCK5620879.1 hypothetical protein [Pseudomonas aeruginosa]